MHRRIRIVRCSRGTLSLRRRLKEGAQRNADRDLRLVVEWATLDKVLSPRDTIHAVVTRNRGWYLAECLEIAVVTQERSLDGLVMNLREAIALHLEGKDLAGCDVVAEPGISLTYELGPRAC